MKKFEETALATVNTETGEIQPTAGVAKEQHEIQSAILIAKQMPRSEAQAFSKLMMACQRGSFADDVTYSFPRGKNEDGSLNIITGPSVHLAREAARVWGNIRYGLDIISDEEESRVIRGWAWDMETNTKVASDDSFKKLIFRKKGGWIKPDERDLRELTNRRGAILVRNCILQLLPKDLVEDALFQARKTIETGAAEDPDSAKKRLLASFATIGVTAEMLMEKFDHPFSEFTPKELTELRGVYKSIADGNSKWSEYAADAKAEKKETKGAISMEDLKEGKFEKPEEKPKPKKKTKAEEKSPKLTPEEAAELAALSAEFGWKPMEFKTLIASFGYKSGEAVLAKDFDTIKKHIEDGTLPEEDKE